MYSQSDVGQPDGYYRTIEIADDGTIINIGSRETFDMTCLDPFAIRISDCVFAVVYEGHQNHQGYLKTIHPRFTSEKFTSGVYKYKSYGIFANSTIISGYINSIMLDTLMPTSGLWHPWHHVVLTYDRNQMRLYVDGELKNFIDLTENIKISRSNLIFGNFFYGYLDEIAIFNRALPLNNITNPTDAIRYHYTNPGVFIN